MSDTEQSNSIIDKAKRFLVRSFNDTVVLFLKRKSEVSLRGKAKVKCIQGKTYIHGFCLNPDGKFYSVFSPNSHSLLVLTTSKSRDTSHNPKSLSSALKAEIPSLRDDEISEMVNLGKNRSAVLVLKLEMSQVYDFIKDFDSFRTLFESSSTKQQQSHENVNLESIKLQIIADAPNKVAVTDFYEEISSQFVKDLGTGTENVPVILICGGKDSGKSTFCRYLVNRALNNCTSVAYLDCDLGQSEFAPSGCVSLTIVSEPLLGPPFTHAQKPLSSCYLGSTQPGSTPRYYVQCLRHVFSSYSKMQPKLPLVINTMGWVEGLGIYFLVETLLIAQPTAVVQIKSIHLRQNLPDLLPGFVAEYVRGPEMLKSKNSDEWNRNEIVSSGLDYKLYDVKSAVSDVQGGRPNLVPADFRALMLLSYIGQNLGETVTGGDVATLHDIPMHRILLKDVVVRIYGAEIQRSHVLCAINATFVGLCTIPSEWLRRVSFLDFPEDLKRIPIECLGFGLVHHVNVEEEAIYIISPLPESVLKRVNCLISGCDGASKHLLLKLKITDECPYVGYPMDCLGCSSMKPRGRHLHRKRAPSEPRSSDGSKTPRKS